MGCALINAYLINLCFREVLLIIILSTLFPSPTNPLSTLYANKLLPPTVMSHRPSTFNEFSVMLSIESL
jgi:hypothetical protein